MGKAPSPDIEQEDQDNFLPIGKKEMLYALRSTLEHAGNGSIGAADYHFKLVTANFQNQFGCMTDPIKPSADETTILVNNLCNIFEEVEFGIMNEEDYFFELILSNFYYTSGKYHPSEQLETTIMALRATFNHEFGNHDLQEKNVSVLIESMTSYNLEVPDIQNVFPEASNNIVTRRTAFSAGILKKTLQGKVRKYKELKRISRRNEQINRLQLNIFQGRSVRGNWSYITMVQLSLLLCVQVLAVGALPVNPIKEQPITLTAGSDGVIPFECTNEHQSAPKYYTVTIEGKDRPFFLDGTLDPEGLKTPDQAERFSVDYVENDNAMSVEINILSVSVQDEGTYTVMLIVQGEKNKYHLMKKVVLIFIPPGPAVCFIESSDSNIILYEIHCHSKPGSGNSTLSCFQNGAKIPYRESAGGDGSQIVDRRTFWLLNMNVPVSCCSHDIKEINTKTEGSCNQFKWPKTQRTTAKTVEIPTEKVAARPSSSYREKEPISLQTTVHSGSAQTFYIWPNLILSLMAIRAYACLYNI